MTLIEKYKRLPPWGKIGAWGSLASLISIPLAFYLTSATPTTPPPSQNIVGNQNVQIYSAGPVNVIPEPSESGNKRTLRANSVRQLSDDLDQIKNLLPPSRVIAKCIQSRGNITYFEGYEICSTESKVNGSHAQALIEKDISNFQAYFDEDEVRPVLELLDEIHGYVYEMHNNSMVHGAWIANSCSDSVKFGGEELLEAEARRNGHRPPKCQLVMTRDRSDIDRPTPSPPYSALSTGRVDKSRVMAIVPGGTKSLKEFFQVFDSELYSEIRDRIDTLKALLVQLK